MTVIHIESDKTKQKSHTTAQKKLPRPRYLAQRRSSAQGEQSRLSLIGHQNWSRWRNLTSDQWHELERAHASAAAKVAQMIDQRCVRARRRSAAVAHVAQNARPGVEAKFKKFAKRETLRNDRERSRRCVCSCHRRILTSKNNIYSKQIYKHS